MLRVIFWACFPLSSVFQGFIRVACSCNLFILPTVYLVRHWVGVPPSISSGIWIAHSLFFFYLIFYGPVTNKLQGTLLLLNCAIIQHV